ncbi:hypothetical protein [Vibrio parahaemolyticus]|uniref:hypothetical protein n=1 Tax=Vibrio parahaemolyticus TaxID=670 RepID=UPI00111E838D|nr:hypothetical protein [Vibrio parahaemolyticus]EGS6497192.1 hypothetical protein [Vibrio parahaemolyticus]ELF4876483.1 hypothetical protein [Vibrio parahaemolyticus]MDF4588542.1 hypothetical protein [Vibrio parahaemolyticus]TOE16208.1 hypothetical protein CGJ50_02090 [Vibrio parahaemolyticus]TOJ04126.1 hypothetical protein CGI48_09320 [Vibrio parahaemolyticus]
MNKINEYVHAFYEVEDKLLIRRIIFDIDSIDEAAHVIRHYSTKNDCEFQHGDIVKALEKYIEESNRYTKQHVIKMLFDVKDNELFSKELQQKTCINDAIVTMCILSDQLDIIDYDTENDDTEELLQEYIKDAEELKSIDEELDKMIAEMDLEIAE